MATILKGAPVVAAMNEANAARCAALAAKGITPTLAVVRVVLMLNQAQGDREILARQLNISPQQMKYVTHTEAGEGLIFYGNVVLPFLDRFPQNTELYRVMTTRPEEVGGT